MLKYKRKERKEKTKHKKSKDKGKKKKYVFGLRVENNLFKQDKTSPLKQ